MQSQPRLLIVEDEPILALELKEDLHDAGFLVVEVVADADKVLSAFLKHRPDLVLMDIKLYGFRDGIDSAVQIRGFYTTPIIFLSSYPEVEVKDRLERAAPYIYLEKPYDLARLKEAVLRLLPGASS